MGLRITHVTGWVAVLALAVAVPVRGQQVTAQVPTPSEAVPPPPPPPVTLVAPPASGPSRDTALKARYQLRVMEGVLENAVQHGARSVGAQMRVVAPDLIFFGSPARARGFRLEGYGVFFDVDVPTLRPSVAWTVRTLSQMSPETTRAIQSLRRIVESQNDARARREAEQALRLVELQVGPVGGEESTGLVPDAPSPVQVPPDPELAYETEVKRALVDAMLDYGNTVQIGEDDWLSVAARASDAMSGSGVDTATIILKIRGRDLQALRVGTITRDVAKQRVVLREF